MKPFYLILHCSMIAKLQCNFRSAYGFTSQANKKMDSQIQDSIKIIPETKNHRFEAENLVGRVFGPGRFAKTTYRLREGVAPLPDLSFVGLWGQEIIGSLRFWPAVIGEKWDVAILGPLAVAPEFAGKGIGRALMHKGLARADSLGWKRILLVGDLVYYQQVGFSAFKARDIFLPGPVVFTRFLGRGSFAGVTGAIRPQKH